MSRPAHQHHEESAAQAVDAQVRGPRFVARSERELDEQCLPGLKRSSPWCDEPIGDAERRLAAAGGSEVMRSRSCLARSHATGKLEQVWALDTRPLEEA